MEVNKYADFKVGAKASLTREITEKDITNFADITGDFNKIHMNAEFAKKWVFKNRICHGLFTLSLISKVLLTKLLGHGCVLLQHDIKYLKPVYAGDKITAEAEIVGKDDKKRLVNLIVNCHNQDNELVLDGNGICKLPDAFFP